jgi:pimeloyl-ACP methyl ester carboxylesterase
MSRDTLIDVHPDDPRWDHAFGPGADGVRLHYVRKGRGPAVVLLHGWPGFWYDWRRVIPRIAEEADVIAPDFRGFGDSDKPKLPPEVGYTPEAFGKDILALLDHLGIREVVVAGHDLGATVAQFLARKASERIRALALFNPSYPGIGMRRFEPSAQRESWYQHFHCLPWSDQLIGYNRDTIRLYLKYFYDHWVGRKETVRPKEFEAIVDVFSRPGVVRGSINHYVARAAVHMEEAEVDPKTLQILQPTVVLWGNADPVRPSNWSDRLQEYFPLLKLYILQGVGHFVPFEAPDEAAESIREAVRSSEHKNSQ